ncbi:MAG: DUF805 domain-containing protein [Pseudomonadales bacterium]|nr:DUF805 domain-containing protein [Pseudomonadales bacterium]
MQAYILALKNAFNFSDRLSRADYWGFVLLNMIISLVLSAVAILLMDVGLVGGLLSLASSLYSLALIIPGLAAAVRRLHDVDKSGWLLLLVLIPVIGWIPLLYWFLKRGSASDNTYGSVVKAVTPRNTLWMLLAAAFVMMIIVGSQQSALLESELENYDETMMLEELEGLTGVEIEETR